VSERYDLTIKHIIDNRDINWQSCMASCKLDTQTVMDNRWILEGSTMYNTTITWPIYDLICGDLDTQKMMVFM